MQNTYSELGCEVWVWFLFHCLLLLLLFGNILPQNWIRQFLKKLNIELLYDPAVLLLDGTPKNWKQELGQECVRPCSLQCWCQSQTVGATSEPSSRREEATSEPSSRHARKQPQSPAAGAPGSTARRKGTRRVAQHRAREDLTRAAMWVALRDIKGRRAGKNANMAWVHL